MKPTLSKDARNAEIIDRGHRIRALLADSVVERFFKDKLQDALDAVLAACQDGDADKIRAAGLHLKILRNMKAHLQNVAADGVRALKQSSEI